MVDLHKRLDICLVEIAWTLESKQPLFTFRLHHPQLYGFGLLIPISHSFSIKKREIMICNLMKFCEYLRKH